MAERIINASDPYLGCRTTAGQPSIPMNALTFHEEVEAFFRIRAEVPAALPGHAQRPRLETTIFFI